MIQYHVLFCFFHPFYGIFERHRSISFFYSPNCLWRSLNNKTNKMKKEERSSNGYLLVVVVASPFHIFFFVMKLCSQVFVVGRSSGCVKSSLFSFTTIFITVISVYRTVYSSSSFSLQSQNGFEELRLHVKEGGDLGKELTAILQERYYSFILLL